MPAASRKAESDVAKKNPFAKAKGKDDKDKDDGAKGNPFAKMAKKKKKK